MPSSMECVLVYNVSKMDFRDIKNEYYEKLEEIYSKLKEVKTSEFFDDNNIDMISLYTTLYNMFEF